MHREMRRTAWVTASHGEIEVVSVALARGLGHGRVAVVRQAGDDGLRLVDREMVFEAAGSLASSATARRDRGP